MSRAKVWTLTAFVVVAVNLIALAFTSTRFQKSQIFNWLLGGTFLTFALMYLRGCVHLCRAKGYSDWYAVTGLFFPYGLFWLIERQDKLPHNGEGQSIATTARDAVAPADIRRTRRQITEIMQAANPSIADGWWRYLYRHPAINIGLVILVFALLVGVGTVKKAMRATPPPETSKDAIVTAAALLIGGGIVWLGVNSMVRLFTFAKRIPGRVLSVGVVERHVPTWVEVEYVLMDQTIREVVPVPDTDGARLKAGDSITLVVDLQSGTAAYNPALAAALPEWSPLKGK